MMQQTQRGVSLISLLVGLVIASIVVLAMMTVYQTSVRAMATSAESARLHSESLASLLTTHLSIQGAGFGVPPQELADNPESAIDLNAAHFNGAGKLVPGGAGTALVWRVGIDTNNDFFADSYQCEGLFVSANRGIVQLVSSDNCATARSNTWPSKNWVQLPLLEPSRLVSPSGEAPVIANFFMRMDDRDPPCSPYGVSATTSSEGVLGRRSVTIGYQRLVDGTNQTVASTTCLVNLLPEDA